MIEMLTSDVVSGALGGVAGYVFRYMAERAKERSEEHKRALELLSARDASMDAAADRDPGTGGTWTRRFIVFCVMVAVVGALFIMPLVNIPIAVETQESHSLLFGLIEWSKPVFTEVRGYLLLPEHRQAFLMLLAFYMGQGVK